MKMFLAAAALLALLLSSSHAQDTDTKCNTTAQGDLVLLVDGSWSVGRINFKTIRSFIARMVSVFDISPDRVQIALAQYSGAPKTEWNLNAHSTKASLLEAISRLPYKGGNTMTGMALNFILENNFKASAGMRENARKIGILITDGKSQDEIVFTSQSLRENGIELYAVGVNNADEGELRSIASDPDDIHMYNVNDFKFLVDIVDELTVNLCNSVKVPVPLSAVKNMNVYDETSTTMKVTWGAAEGATGYMMLYRATNATEPQLEQEIRVGGEVTDVQLVQLTPSTAYSISLYALYGDALEGTGVTLPVPPVGVLTITDVTHSTMKLRWDAAPGAVRRYIVTYKPEQGDLKETEVDGNIVTLDLSGLISQTEYDVAVTPVYDEGPINPLLGTAITGAPNPK